MDLQNFLDHVNRGALIEAGSGAHSFMHGAAPTRRCGPSPRSTLGYRSQDTGAITIGDGTLIGHGSTLTTLDHGIDPRPAGDLIPAPAVIGRKVWLGAAVTVVPAVTIAGVPAKLIRMTVFDASLSLIFAYLRPSRPQMPRSNTLPLIGGRARIAGGSGCRIHEGCLGILWPRRRFGCSTQAPVRVRGSPPRRFLP
jgi:hypothetical protein